MFRADRLQPYQRWLLVVCGVCGRAFRREGDNKRHKCIRERSKPVCEQRGACSPAGFEAGVDWHAVHNFQPQLGPRFSS